MTLPRWYVDCAEDYLSILSSAKEYSQSELFEATRNQRAAEYKLMKEKRECATNENAPISNPPPPASLSLQPLSLQPLSPLSLQPLSPLSLQPLSLRPLSLRQYGNSMMSRGFFQTDVSQKNAGEKGFWENILK